MLPIISRIYVNSIAERGISGSSTILQLISRPTWKRWNFLLRRKCCTLEADELMEEAEVRKYLSAIRDEFKKHEKTNSNAPILSLLREREDCEKYLKSLDVLFNSNDKEMEDLIKLDRIRHQKKIQCVNKSLVMLAMPEDEYDNRNAFLEISAGAGGAEARLFAEELCEMYTNFASYKGWEVHCTGPKNCDDGVHHGTILLSGQYVFRTMKHEAGVHRVQRVPTTSNSGKIHTSTCKVLVLPETEDTDVVIKSTDLKYDYKTSPRPGGQNVNKVETCVRLTHIPTGVTVEVKDTRSQEDNKKLALVRLKNSLFQAKLKDEAMMMNKLIKMQAVTADRSDKMRTYNFLQNRVTDHVLNYTMFNLSGFLRGSGALDELISLRMKHYRRNCLLNNMERMVREKNFDSLFGVQKSHKVYA